MDFLTLLQLFKDKVISIQYVSTPQMAIVTKCTTHCRQMKPEIAQVSRFAESLQSMTGVTRGPDTYKAIGS